MRGFSRSHGFTLISRACQGFTLIELLVVIAILAVLATLSITLFSTVQRNIRDGKTQADVNNIARAIEGSRTISTANGTITYTYRGANFLADFKTTSISAANGICARTSNFGVLPLPPVAGWTATCPGGWQNVSSTSVSTCGPATPGSYVNGLPLNCKYWKVCALLESGTIYCKDSISQ